MATTVISPQSNGSSGGLIVGLILAAGIIVALIIFGLPYLRNQQNQPQQPTNINVTLPIPTPSPAPSPTPK